MRIDYPEENRIPQLRQLWKEAFGDDDAFLDKFFSTAFAADRCRCGIVDDKLAAALYWFDCKLDNRPIAYLYAVAVAKSHRKQGLGKALLADTQAHLAFRGYDGVLLVPGSGDLRSYYEKLGYRTCTHVHEFPARAGLEAIPLQRIDRDEYARLRSQMLPAGSGLDVQENIAFLETTAFFYRGENLLLAAHAESGKLWCPEYLGDPDAAPGILKGLSCAEGLFRTPGDTFPFAMFLPLTDGTQSPTHLGLAFD